MTAKVIYNILPVCNTLHTNYLLNKRKESKLTPVAWYLTFSKGHVYSSIVNAVIYFSSEMT